MADLITKDLHPRRIEDIAQGLLASAGEHPEYGPEAADIGALIAYIAEVQKWQKEILLPAVDSIIMVHRHTGIDLKQWEPVLRLVQSARPEFSIEGEPEW